MENNTATIPYFAHEGEMARFERTNKRLWVIVIILIIALVGSNVGWLIYESQFETESITESYNAEADGNSNAILNGSGEVIINGVESGLHKDSSQTGESK